MINSQLPRRWFPVAGRTAAAALLVGALCAPSLVSARSFAAGVAEYVPEPALLQLCGLMTNDTVSGSVGIAVVRPGDELSEALGSVRSGADRKRECAPEKLRLPSDRYEQGPGKVDLSVIYPLM